MTNNNIFNDFLSGDDDKDTDNNDSAYAAESDTSPSSDKDSKMSSRNEKADESDDMTNYPSDKDLSDGGDDESDDSDNADDEFDDNDNGDDKFDDNDNADDQSDDSDNADDKFDDNDNADDESDDSDNADDQSDDSDNGDDKNPEYRAEETAEQYARQTTKTKYDEFREQVNAEERRREQKQRDWLEFERVRPDTLEKNRKVFVESPAIEQFRMNRQSDLRDENNIYIVSGAAESGRYATALCLARNIANGSEIREHIPDITTRSMSLRELIERIDEQIYAAGSHTDGQETTLSEGAVIIVEDAFDNPDSDKPILELSPRYVNQFRRLLDKARLILTTTASPTRHPDMENYLYVRTTDSEGNLEVDLADVFDTHMDWYLPDGVAYYSELRNLLKKIKNDILQHLSYPADIDRYMARVATDTPETEEEAVNRARSMMQERSTIAMVQRWFDGLQQFNQKLYVIFAVLLDGLKRPQLDDFYSDVVRELRESTPEKYDDPRYISVRNMLDDIHMKEKQNSKLMFIRNQAAHERVIRAQLEDYYRLLWDLSGLFVRKINQPHTDRRLRRLLATVLGQVGVYRQKELQTILTHMCESNNPRVAEAVTYTLIEIARLVDHHDFLIKILGDWINSHLFPRMMAAISGIAGVYREIGRVYPRAVHIANQDGDIDDSNLDQLDKNRIAADTLRQLNTFLNRFCEDLGNVQMSQYLEELKRNREQIEDELRRKILQMPHVIRLRREHPEEIQRNVNSLVQSHVDDIMREMQGAIQIEILDQLTLTAVERIAEIAASLPAQAVHLLRTWLTFDSETTRWRIARMVINELFDQPGRQQTVVSNQHLKLLDLLPEILEASVDVSGDIFQLLLSGAYGRDMQQAGGGQARQRITELVRQRPILKALAALERWYEILDTDYIGTDAAGRDIIWQQTIYPALLKTLNHARQLTRRILAASLLSTWFNSQHVEVQQNAMTLLTRAYVLDGRIVDIPGSRHGVIMIDAGNLNRDVQQDYYEGVFEIAQRMAARTSIHLYHMGYSVSRSFELNRYNPMTGQSNTMRANDLQLLEAARPVLMMPFIEPLDDTVEPLAPDGCHFVLILNMSKILDWNDVLTDALEGYDTVRQARETYNPFQQYMSENVPPSDPASDTADSSPADIPDTNTLFATSDALSDPTIEPETVEDNPFQQYMVDDPADTIEPDDSRTSATELEKPEPSSDVDDQPTESAQQALPSDTYDWDWHGKFFINATGNTDWLQQMETLPSGIVTHYRISAPPIQKSIRSLEDALQQRLILNLQTLPNERLLDDLNGYLAAGEADFTLSLQDTAHYLKRIDDYIQTISLAGEQLRQQDSILVVTWAMLVLSRHDLEQTVATIVSWLKRSDDTRYSLIGRTCTRQLFNFYSAAETPPDVTDYAALLPLLPPYMALQPSRHAFGFIIETLFEWAKEKGWSDRLVSGPDAVESEITVALRNIHDAEDVQWLLNEIQYREALLRIQEVVLLLSQGEQRRISSVRDFVELLNQLIQWVNKILEIRAQQEEQEQQKRRSRRRRRRRRRRSSRSQTPPSPDLPEGISDDVARQLLELPGFRRQNRDRLLHDLQRQQQELFNDKQFRRQYPDMMRNLKAVLDTMQLQVHSTGDDLPVLDDNRLYGVILVDVTSQTATEREQITGMVIDFLEQLVAHDEGHLIIPVVHRMGRQDVVYTHQLSSSRSRKKRIRLRPETIAPPDLTHRFVPLVGPVLERYRPDDVGFVFIVTATPVHDIKDWSQQDVWVGRMFSHIVGRGGQTLLSYTIEEIQSTDTSGNAYLPAWAVERVMSKRYRRDKPDESADAPDAGTSDN